MKLLFLMIAVSPLAPACRDHAGTDKSLLGRDSQYVLSRYGKLAYDKTFYLSRSTNLYEYQGDLAQFFPNLNEHGSAQIREMSFHLNGVKLSVWFKRQGENWIVFDDFTLDANAMALKNDQR